MLQPPRVVTLRRCRLVLLLSPTLGLKSQSRAGICVVLCGSTVATLHHGDYFPSQVAGFLGLVCVRVYPLAGCTTPGIAITQNTPIWGTENPRSVQVHEAHSEKITVWCAIHFEDVLDPYYFDNETVRKEDYCELLDTYVRNEPKNFPANAFF